VVTASTWVASSTIRSNWLPAPDGPFSLYLRAYWPEQDILDGTWTLPPVTRLTTSLTPDGEAIRLLHDNHPAYAAKGSKRARRSRDRPRVTVMTQRPRSLRADP
jgi:hypothetical protein